MLILAHRGASAYAPENTKAAFALAVARGADGVELDVHLTKDGQMVAHHNLDIRETSNGTGEIWDMTLAELRRFDFGSWKGEAFAGESILTLEEALILVKDMTLINIELKTAELTIPSLPDLACALVKKMGLVRKVIFSSFRHETAMACKKCLPQAKAGLLYSRPLLRPVSYARRLGADALHPYKYLVTPGLIHRAHRAGLMVNTWTVDKPEWIQRLACWGCDAVITNVPGR